MELRKATLAEAQAIFDIRIAAIRARCTGHYTPEELDTWTAGKISAEFLKHVEEIFHVATVGGRVVGTGFVDLGTGELGALFVEPAFMRRGIGRAMMAHLEELAADAGLARREGPAGPGSVRAGTSCP